MTISDSVCFSDVGKNDPGFSKEEQLREVCISNISPLERQRRLRYGIIQFVTTLVILGMLVGFGINHYWRLPLLIMFWAAAVGYFQARDKT